MRSKLNLHGSTSRLADKLGMSHIPVPRMPLSHVSPMPMEWLDAGSWRLPSGKALAEFALQAGFLAPLLFKSEHFGVRHRDSRARTNSSEPLGVPSASKQLGKGNR